MNRIFEVWRTERIQRERPCTVEPEMDCLPLRNDPICGECFDADRTDAGRKETDDALQGH